MQTVRYVSTKSLYIDANVMVSRLNNVHFRCCLFHNWEIQGLNAIVLDSFLFSIELKGTSPKKYKSSHLKLYRQKMENVPMFLLLLLCHI